MDIYQATKQILQTACPSVDIDNVMFPFTQENIQSLSIKPRITYEYSNNTEQATHQGNSGIHKVQHDINLWGDLDKISSLKNMISATLNAKRITVGDWEFTLIENMVQDIFEPNITSKRILMRFTGIAIN